MLVANDVTNATSSPAVTEDMVLTSSAALEDQVAPRFLLKSLSSAVATAAAGIQSSGSDAVLKQQVNWYMIIAILSALVLIGMCFTICRLMIKATAHEKAGLDWNRDSLLYSRKDSIIPISLHFEQNDGDGDYT